MALWKEKTNYILVLIIPLLVNLLLGVEFSKGVISHIPMAVVDMDNSSVSRMIVQQFRENEPFALKYQMEDEAQIKQLMDNSKIRVGMIIPKGFSDDVKSSQSPTVLMLYDGSHMSVASVAKAKASEILMTLKTGVGIKLIGAKLSVPADIAKNIALSVKFTNRTLYNPTKSFENFLNPGFGVAIVQTGIALAAVVVANRNRFIMQKGKRLMHVMHTTLFFTVLGTAALLLSIFVQTKLFGLVFRGGLAGTVLLSVVFAAAVSSFAVMVGSALGNVSFAILVNAVYFIPSTILVGYTWPVIAMPQIYQNLAHTLPFYHYADPLRDLYLKGLTFAQVLPQALWFCEFTGVMLFLIAVVVLLIPTSVNKKEDECIAMA
ncbi:MAG: ABC transporter permease [Hyphomonadaceae bacterium]|nr:ABC transporter permease [Clostridia bacterium]